MVRLAHYPEQSRGISNFFRDSLLCLDMSEAIPKIEPESWADKAPEVHESILVPKISLETEGQNSQVPEVKKKKTPMKLFKIIKILAAILLVLFLILIPLFYNVYKKARKVQTSGQNLVAAANSKDLAKIKSELGNTKFSLVSLKTSYKTIAWLKFVPFLGAYVSDGAHVINAAFYGIEGGEIFLSGIEPYADIIGFAPTSEKPGSGQETAEDRMDFVLKTLPEITSKMDELEAKVSLVRKEVDFINPDRYPVKIAGREVREKLKKIIEYTDVGADMISRGKPLLEEAPYILGMDKEKRYLILFQNDKELRPTGGFMTAYAIAKVDKGMFEPVSSSDMYNLDAQYRPVLPAPDPMIKYLKGPYVLSKNLRLRDMNWSPDFGESMALFSQEAQKVGIKGIDGIIAVDTQVLVYLLDVLGPIGVPGYGEFSTKIVPECNCPQVIYELESFADVEGPIVWSENEPGKIVYAPPNWENRKKIIGPLMNSILANALGQPKDKLSALFEATFKSLTEKHALFYLTDEKAQGAVSTFGIAGKILDYQEDYLHINDANLGGRKSNLYVTQEVVQEIKVAKDGSVEKTLTLTYKNPEKYDGWLNSVLPNWVRIYVPKGSTLISFNGVEEKVSSYEEFDKTVFAGFFKLRPEGIAKLTLKYKLPFKVKVDYKLLIQKQSGTNMPLYTIKLGKEEQEFFLKSDKELRLKI